MNSSELLDVRRWRFSMAASMLMLTVLSFGLRLAAQGSDPPPPPGPLSGTVERLDPELDRLVSSSARVEIAYPGPKGVSFEGPTWVVGKPGHLDFSALGQNKILMLSVDGTVTPLLDPIVPPSEMPTPPPVPAGAPGRRMGLGSNGTALDINGDLVFCLYGGVGRIDRVKPDGTVQVVADNYGGKPLQSPNDIIVRSDGSIYYTQQRAGGGVYIIRPGGTPELLEGGPLGPNGLAFSPDEKILYTTDDHSDVPNEMSAATGHPRRLMRYDVRPDGTIANGKVFVDMKNDPGWGFVDGLKVDKDGYLWAVGPSGVWVITPDGRHIGTIHAPVARFTNLGFGGDDGKTLYLTSAEGVYKLQLASSRINFPQMESAPSGASQKGEPIAPGAPVAGHWAGNFVMEMAATKRQVQIKLDFVLEQDGNKVRGTLNYITPAGGPPHAVPVEGIEEQGQLTLRWDFTEVEHCRLHLAIDGDTLNGTMLNFRDNPHNWGNDASGVVALTRVK